MGHPAHFYIYKNVIPALKEHGNEVAVLIKKKDILEQLLKDAGIPYHNILREGRRDSKMGIFIGLLKRTIRLALFCRGFKPDILTGTSVENSFLGKLHRIPVINVNEDDAAVVPFYAKLSYPGASEILCPVVCDCGEWNPKAIKYESYHELAYLHPDNFTPDKAVVERYFHTDSPYFIIRFAKLNAHHDSGIKGISTEMAHRLVKMLSERGRVFITSERELDAELEPYRIHIHPLDMHHIMAFASIYIGDSQTMAAEAGVLGTPFVRFNDFVGRIGYLNELENKYELGYGITTDKPDELFTRVRTLMDMPSREEIFNERRERMLADKINYASFLTWFIEDYPRSAKQMRENPDTQFNFR